VFFEILLTTYLLKFVVMLVDTPFIYWARSFSNTVLAREQQESLVEGQ
jgi:uncharacterized PurR-regulated membrane protein YhhQ (DUF165 family)